MLTAAVQTRLDPRVRRAAEGSTEASRFHVPCKEGNMLGMPQCLPTQVPSIAVQCRPASSNTDAALPDSCPEPSEPFPGNARAKTQKPPVQDLIEGGRTVVGQSLPQGGLLTAGFLPTHST